MISRPIATLLRFALGFAACVLGLSAATKPPNVVFILTDDLGIFDLGCYGRTDHRTPHLDRLAAEGVRFTSAYCSQPICSPSRAGLMTGRHPARLHLTTFLPGRPDTPSQPLRQPRIVSALPAGERTLAHHLRDAGYITASFGKWHLGGAGAQPVDFGFHTHHPGRANTTPEKGEGGKGESFLTDAALAFLSTNSHRPFFLFLSHDSPHIPYSAPADRVEQAQARGAFEPVYAALIETLDASIGRLRQGLEDLGLATNTMVVFTSDNGGLHVPELQHRRVTHNGVFRAGKGFVYEGGLRVPLIVWAPGFIPGGRVLDLPVMNTDWLPTLAEWAGRPDTGPVDGVSLTGLLRTGAPLAPRRLYWHFPHYSNQGGQPAGAVREGPWKLIEHAEDQRVELYNLAEDPGEQSDIGPEEPTRVIALRSALAAWRIDVGAQTNSPNPNWDPGAYRPLYVEFEPSHFDPFRSTSEQWNRAWRWRQDMDAAARPPSPKGP